MKKLFAFTLAEVLITLAIIGFVAVLTIPRLVENYQSRSWNTASEEIQKKLGEACDRIPDFLVVKIECKFYRSEDSFVPMIRRNV